jgi:AraC family transcriptional regulator
MLVQLAQNTVGIALERTFIVISVPGGDARPTDLGEGPLTMGRRHTPLQKWRMKRVVDYVGAHLSHRITLADMSAAAGLTRMHFAAQFRAATGMRPHDYLLQRKIDRAQELLRDPKLALVDVALSVGFQTQAHFTTVFKRFAGETPNRWRRQALEVQAPQRAVFRRSATPSDVVMHDND